MDLATEIVIFDAGRISQRGTPREIYNEPNSSYVARFIGSVNEFEGSVVDNRTPCQVVTSSGMTFTCYGETRTKGADVTIMVRPEAWTVTRDTDLSKVNSWPAVVKRAEFLGAHTAYHVEVGSETIKVWDQPQQGFQPGERVGISVEPRSTRILGSN
jgi:ABC-type Fe3+/spermidine/putrescine transport system ATPase subunit